MHSVLVVDDEPFLRLSLASLKCWTEVGFDSCAEAANGVEALAVLQARPEIDIMLLDLSMPVMDGLETLRQLRVHRPVRAPATIVLSAHDDFHLVRQAFQLGAVDYLRKGELEVAALETALQKAASGLAASDQHEAAKMQRRHLEFLKAQVLRDLLTAPTLPELEETFQSLQIGVTPPFCVCCFWVEDFGRVATRQGADGMGQLSSVALRTLGQALARWGQGEVIEVAPGQFAALFSGRGEGAERLDGLARSFVAEAAVNVGRYLSVKVCSAVGPACAHFRDAPDSYRAARSVRPVESRIVVLAKRAIHECFADPAFSLEVASERAGVSKNHLSYEFSREAGETFTEYLSRIRIQEAKRLLATTALLVSQVGELVGYPNVEHFSRVFKKSVGVSPVRFKTGALQDEPDVG